MIVRPFFFMGIAQMWWIEETDSHVLMFLSQNHVMPDVTFPKKYNLSLALAYLQQINQLQTEAGIPIYAIEVYNGVSLWSFWQTYLYDQHVRIWVRYQSVLEWLMNLGWPKVEAGHISEDLQRFLVLTGCLQDSDQGQQENSLSSAFFEVINVIVLRILQFFWVLMVRLSKAKILVYTPDIVSDGIWKCDFRFAKVYAFLTSSGYAYAEVFHRLGLIRGFKNAIARRRIPLYIENWEHINPSSKSVDLNYESLDLILQPLARHVVPIFLGRCKTSAARIDGLRLLLRQSKLRVMIGMDDFRANNELLLACRLEGVRTILVLHGLITRFHAGWHQHGIPKQQCVRPDHFLVYAHFWKRVLDKWSTHLCDMSTVVSGWEESEVVCKTSSKANPHVDDGRIAVLVFMETLWDPIEARAFFAKMVADSRLQIIFKVRPDISATEQVATCFSKESQPDLVVDDLGKIIDQTDVIVGSHTSLLYKMLRYRIPVLRMVTSFEYGDQLNIFGLAGQLFIEDDFYEVFKKAVATPQELYEERFQKYIGDGNYPDYRDTLASLLHQYI